MGCFARTFCTPRTHLHRLECQTSPPQTTSKTLIETGLISFQDRTIIQSFRSLLVDVLDEDVPVPRLVRLDILESLPSFTHRQRLDPRPHILCTCQFEHLKAFLLAADVTSAEKAPVPGEGLHGVEGGQGAGGVGEPDGDEGAVHPERGQVIVDGQRAVDYIRRGDDQV